MDRRQRKAEQRAKYEAMSRPRKVAMFALNALAGGLTSLVVGYVLGGELRVGFSIVMGVVLAATVALTTAFMFRNAS